MNKGTNKSLIGAGILAAIASSLCCIVPVIAGVASISGIAASFSWLEPARPFLIGFTVLVLGFAWYQHIKNKKAEVECDCEEDASAEASAKVDKPTFLQSTKFMWIITVFSAVMLSFPYYSGVFFPESEKTSVSVNSMDIAEAKLEIEGMTCDGCEHHVTQSLTDQAAVIEATSSYKEGTALVKFDKSKTTIEELSKIVETETGYLVTNQEIIN
ncbi:MAG: mercuric transport protein MerTP [Flavobacteriales bacterium]|nr:mercuric transport protein MerTP [Flavobacteriales bacterium]